MKRDAMQMGGHDDISIDSQALLPMAEIQALRDDFARGLRDEYGEPLDDREGNVK
jgi:hypothetical protein